MIVTRVESNDSGTASRLDHMHPEQNTRPAFQFGNLAKHGTLQRERHPTILRSLSIYLHISIEQEYELIQSLSKQKALSREARQVMAVKYRVAVSRDDPHPSRVGGVPQP
jgi:hypothetical protein